MHDRFEQQQACESGFEFSCSCHAFRSCSSRDSKDPLPSWERYRILVACMKFMEGTVSGPQGCIDGECALGFALQSFSSGWSPLRFRPRSRDLIRNARLGCADQSRADGEGLLA